MHIYICVCTSLVVRTLFQLQKTLRECVLWKADKYSKCNVFISAAWDTANNCIYEGFLTLCWGKWDIKYKYCYIIASRIPTMALWGKYKNVCFISVFIAWKLTITLIVECVSLKNISKSKIFTMTQSLVCFRFVTFVSIISSPKQKSFVLCIILLSLVSFWPRQEPNLEKNWRFVAFAPVISLPKRTTLVLGLFFYCALVSSYSTCLHRDTNSGKNFKD